MKKLLSLVLVVTVFLFFTAGVFAQAKEEAAKAEAAKAAEAATAGISTGTIVAGVLVAAAIAAAIAAAGAPAKAAPTPSAVAQSAAQTLSTSNPQVAASLSTLAQTLALDDAKNLGTFIARAANNAQSLSEFKTAISGVDTVSEIEAAISGLAPAGVSELRTYLTSLKSRDPAAYNALLALLQHIVTVGKANSEAGNKMAKGLHDAIVNIDTSKPEQVTAVVQAASAMAQDPTTFQVAYLTAMHPGYTITLTQTHIGGGVYMTVTHFTPKH